MFLPSSPLVPSLVGPTHRRVTKSWVSGSVRLLSTWVYSRVCMPLPGTETHEPRATQKNMGPIQDFESATIKHRKVPAKHMEQFRSRPMAFAPQATRMFGQTSNSILALIPWGLRHVRSRVPRCAPKKQKRLNLGRSLCRTMWDSSHAKFAKRGRVTHAVFLYFVPFVSTKTQEHL